jgi:hypothetical protein
MTRAELDALLDQYREAIRHECTFVLPNGTVTDDIGLAWAIKGTESVRAVLNYECGRLIASSHAPRPSGAA